jgi:hypothetical protein
MTNRIVKVLGWGLTSSTITAILDGETVFSGDVELTELTSENNSAETAPTLFSFEIPMNFAGTKHMVISVTNATVTFGQIVANYTEIDHGAITYSSGPDIYADIAVRDPLGVCDPRGDVVIINGEKREADRTMGKGTWHWVIPPGATFEHDVVVSKAGIEED